MPDQLLSVDGAPAARMLAERFTAALGWPGPARVTAGTDGDAALAPGDHDARVRLEHIIGAPHPAEASWWRAAAEDWLALGQQHLAQQCLDQARQLILAGADADWADLEALAALAARVEALAARSQLNLRTLQAGRDARVNRLTTALQGQSGTGDADTADTADSGDTANTAGSLPALVLAARGSFSAALARAFFEAGEYRLVVEQFLALICGDSLQDWRANHFEELTWCGQALLKLGDQASAFACFALLVGSDATPSDDSPQQPDQDPVRMIETASRYVAMLRGYTTLDSPDGQFGLFGDGVRLAQWLLARQSEGLFPDFADRIRTGPLRDRPAVLVRQMSRIARDSGWFVPSTTQVAEQSRAYRRTRPLTELMLPPAPPSAGAMAWSERQRTTPTRTSRIRSRSGWSSPAPAIGAPASRAAEYRPAQVSVPLGVTASGGDARLELGPGDRVALIGQPFGGALLATVGEHLSAAGWTPVLVTMAGTAASDAARGWPGIRFAGVSRSAGKQWLPWLKASGTVRGLIRSGLTALLPGEADPLAPACLDKLAEALADTRINEWFFTEERPRVLDFASWIVGEATDIRCDTVDDLRRTARMLDFVRAALDAVAAALLCQWPSAAPGSEQDGGAVCVELSADSLPSALRLSVLLGSLASAAQAAWDARLETLQQQQQVVKLFEDFTLQVHRREDGIDEETQRTASEAAASTPLPAPDESPSPSAGASRPAATDEKENPWVTSGLVPLDGHANVCVLIDYSTRFPDPALMEWLDAYHGPHAVVIAAAGAVPAALTARGGFTEILIGSVPAHQLALCEISAGISLRCLREQRLGRLGAVRVRPGQHCDVGDPVMVWPVRPAGEGGK